MKLAVPKEINDGERRVAIVPESVKKLVKAGLTVVVERNAGATAFASDAEYVEAGATIESDVVKLLGEADIVLKVQPPVMRKEIEKHEASLMKSGAILLATLRTHRNLDVVRMLAEAKVTSFSTDAIPRITRAQSMDVLSSQATIAGYKAVLIASNEIGKMFPMLMTAAGTILSAKVLIIGAGVAGLQAIATARRLGATVEAFDTRPVVKEQVQSLGARFVEVPTTGEDAQDAGGYAKKLSDEYYKRQSEVMAKHIASADVVITTALIGGTIAPKLITEEMVKAMRPGSVIVDLAAEGGGNCCLTELGKTIVKYGVTICGPMNLPAGMPIHASQMYSRNLTTFVLEFYKNNAFNLDLNDEIIKGAIITHNGEVLHQQTREAMQKGAAT